MSDDSGKMRVGVIGCGHWGPNHIRVFSDLDRACVTACSDTSRARLHRIHRRFPRVQSFTDFRQMLDEVPIDAVVVATPTHTHATIARECLKAGKHALVEKPLCTRSAEGQDLTALAEASGLVLMVGHVFLYNNGIRTLRESINRGELGRIHYLDAVRTNLGPVRGDVNALYDLGTHDISIFNYLMGSAPVAVSALGSCISQRNIEDVCFATLRYADGTMGHIHVSWMNPRKVRTITVVGERKMAHWDDIDPSDTLRLFDKGIDEQPRYDSFGEFHYLLRQADVHIPKIEQVEPLVNQANAFLDSVLDGAPCRSGGLEAAAIVTVLEAAARSIREEGRLCSVELPVAAETEMALTST